MPRQIQIVILVSFTLLSLWEFPAALQIASGHSPLLSEQSRIQASTAPNVQLNSISPLAFVSQGETLTSTRVPDIFIDFDSIVSLPFYLRPTVQEVVMAQIASLPNSTKFYVSTYRISASGDWARVVLVPDYVVASNWEAFNLEDMIELLVQRGENGVWVATLYTDDNRFALSQSVPSDFIDFSSLINSTSVETYRFPWTSGQSWWKNGGWHGANHGGLPHNSIDFQPINQNASNFAVLAASRGWLDTLCGPDANGQIWLSISNSDGTSGYGHLTNGGIRSDLFGTTVQIGQYLGNLFEGHSGCGDGSPAHLHFVFPNRNIFMYDAKKNRSVLATEVGEDTGNGNVSYTSNNIRHDATLATIYGSVQLEGRPAPPHDRWRIPLQITLIPIGGSTVVHRDTTTEHDGRFIISGILPSAYSIRVKNPQMLSVQHSVNLNLGANHVQMGLLRAGDADNDNDIDIFDYQRLVAEFGTRSQPGNCSIHRRSDFDGDCDTDIYDYSYLVGNFGQIGTTSNQEVESSANAVASFGLRVSPSSFIKTVGEEFDVNVEIAVPNEPAVATQIFLNFNPGVLRVVSITPGTILPDILLNPTYNNRTGRINFAAGRQSEPYPRGVFTALTIRFRVVGGTPGTVLDFNMLSPRETAATSHSGNGVLDVIDDGFIIASAVNSAPFINYFTTDTPTLRWGTITWATSYEVVVARDRNFTNQVYRVIGTALETTISPALENGVYFWRVRAIRANGTSGGWSKVDSFTIHES